MPATKEDRELMYDLVDIAVTELIGKTRTQCPSLHDEEVFFTSIAGNLAGLMASAAVNTDAMDAAATKAYYDRMILAVLDITTEGLNLELTEYSNPTAVRH
jgi:hypothetical protein